MTIHVADITPTPTPTPGCTSVATPNTVQVNTPTTVSIAVTNITPAKDLVGFNCAAFNKQPIANACTVSNFFTLPGYSVTTNNFNYGNWISNDLSRTSSLSIGADFLFTSTGDKTFDVYGADDNNGDNQVTCPITMHVIAPPTVNAITVSPNPVQVNTATSASANFTDSSSGSHTATWNWGDGNSTSGTVTEPNGSTPGSVSNTHTYAATGVYTVTLQVTNTSNNDSETSTYQYVAVYDSNTSFAGGSSYDNPSSASPSTTGKVKFGISAKYNNSNVLTGNVKMNFKAGNIDFASTSLTSLATSNGKAYLQGSGTVNGTSGYTFLATGIDGSVVGGSDLIRFQIMDSSNTVIYDSQPGAGNTDDPTTTVATGNIRVH